MCPVTFVTDVTGSDLQQERSLWGQIDYTNYLSKDKKWAYLIHSETRIIQTPNIKGTYPLQTVLGTFGAGYKLNPKLRVWLGYYQDAHSPFHSSYAESRLWQQLYYRAIDNNKIKLHFRTRLEENKFTDTTHKYIIFRQVLQFEVFKYHYGNVYPTSYDEVFVPLNYKYNTLRSYELQNRLFTGISIYTSSKNSYFKIGYMNQYFYNRIGHKDTMNHILSIMYVFGKLNIIRPVSE